MRTARSLPYRESLCPGGIRRDMKNRLPRFNVDLLKRHVLFSILLYRNFNSVPYLSLHIARNQR